MADREAKIRFTAETQDLNSQIKSSENSLKELRSELKLNTTDMKANGESAENLKNRLNILGNEMQAAKDKTQAVSDKLEVAKGVFGENSVEVQNLQTQLNNCQSVENGIQSDINATTESLNAQEEANSQLSTELESLNSTIETNSSELEVNAAQLQNADDQTDLLNERMQLLQEQYDASNEKVALLSTALEQSASATGTSTDEYHNLQSALQQATIENENIKSSMSSTQESMAGTPATIGDIIDGFKNIPGAAGIAVTAIAEIGTAAIEAAEELKVGYDEIIERTGATGEALEELKVTMEETFSTLPTDAETAGAAVGEIATRFQGLSDNELQTMTDKFVKFSDITNTNVASAVGLASQTMNKYGLDASGVSDYLDKIAYTSQATGVSTSSLMNTVMSNSDVFKTYGMSLDEAIEFTGRMETAGVDASSVLGQMRSKADDLAAASGTTARDGLNQLSASINGASSDTEALSLAADVFSARQANKMVEAAQLGVLNFDDLSLSAETCAGTVDTTFETTINGTDKFKEATNNLKVSGAEIGDMFLEDIATPLINSVTPALDTLRDQLNGDGKSAIEDYAQALADGSIQYGTFQADVAGIIALFPQLCENVGTANDTIVEKFEDLRSGAGEKIDGFKEDAKAKFEELKVGIPAKAEELKSSALTKFESLKTGALSKFANIKSDGIEKFEALKSGIKGKIDAARDAVDGAIKKIKGFFNFSISWPHIPMPHFSVSPPGWQIGDLLKGSIPSLGITWHAEGGIFTRPTILSTANGIHGFGEAGAEAILPIDKMYDYVERAVWNTMAATSEPFDYDRMRDMFMDASKNIDASVIIGNRQFRRVIEESI